MKIAFTSKGKDLDSIVDARFGRCEYILIYDEETELIDIIENSDSAAEAHGAGPKTAQRLFNANIDILITGNGPGGNAAKVLERTKMQIFIGAGDKSIKEALEDFKANKLEKL
ncbi:MAG: NifB/NifX family molybdenum-iron cluster-binding protein [Bacteroidetes bacterium]|nr:NifB/NifX family molybdenum-iron cluster-binding protein [Bacteroidota bacterium]MBU1114735.1 NifB/NifX family molybdenum-iron cluster-binding protein [Bacteroidota bacterium]MBU1796866.1 NifB/NifX family molybdenum-iron cluster-binding protein [Bacteroidota bacterium]